MDENRFKLDINLQKLSMVSIAVKLWHAPDIKSRIRNYFSKPRNKHPDQNWFDISKLVVQLGDSMGLPFSVVVELKKIIFSIGEKIYSWIFYVTEVLKLNLVFTEKIYFSYNALDAIKIFDLHWKDMSVDNFKSRSSYFKYSPLFSLACMYACERFIIEHKNEMLDELEKFYPQIKTGDEVYNIMSVSICLTANKSPADYVSRPLKMLELCLEGGFNKAARFYWNRLDEIEKVSNLTNLAGKCFREDDTVIRDTYCENLLFLINQMQEDEKCIFFENHVDKIIKLLLPVWPYRELIVYLFEFDWNIDSSRSALLLEFVLKLTKRLAISECPVDNQLHFRIVQKAWGKIPDNKKVDFLRKSHMDLFLSFDLAILNLIFNDPVILDDKKLDYSRCRYVEKGTTELANMGKFHFIDEVIKEVFNSDPKHKEKLKENVQHFVRDLVEKDKFEVVDQFLDWATESDEERVTLKNKLRTISICEHLMFQLLNLRLAEKFLKWRLESDEEVKNFKEDMKSYQFVSTKDDDYVRIKSGDLSELKPGDSLGRFTDSFGRVKDSSGRFITEVQEPKDGFALVDRKEATGKDLGVVFKYIPRSSEIRWEKGRLIKIQMNRNEAVGMDIEDSSDSELGANDNEAVGMDTEESSDSELETDGDEAVGMDIKDLLDAEWGANRLTLSHYEDEFEIENNKPYASNSPINYIGKEPGDYIVHKVYEIWDRKSSMDKSYTFQNATHFANSFIKFYYETDEEVEEFKKTKFSGVLDTENLIEFLFNTFFKDRSYVRIAIIDAFLQFCLIPSDRIEEIKNRYRNDIEKLMDHYLIDKFDLAIADFCISWLYDAFGKDKKKEIIKKILNSSNKGAMLCASYLNEVAKSNKGSNGDLEYVSSSSKFQIASWLTLVDDKKKLKNDLFALDPNPKDWFVTFLDKLTQTDVMTAVTSVEREFFGRGSAGGLN